MARLTYAALALAAASLVAGFFIRTTAVPLFASIGLSALVLILIMRGWAKRMREAPEDGEAPRVIEDVEDVEAGDIVVVDPEEAGVPAAAATTRLRRSRRSRVPEPEPEAEPEQEDVDEAPTPRRRREVGKRPRTASAPEPAATRTARPAGGGRVVVLPGRTRYHAPGCRFARGKGAEEIAEATARRRRYRPCSVCLPG